MFDPYPKIALTLPIEEIRDSCKSRHVILTDVKTLLNTSYFIKSYLINYSEATIVHHINQCIPENVNITINILTYIINSNLNIAKMIDSTTDSGQCL